MRVPPAARRHQRGVDELGDVFTSALVARSTGLASEQPADSLAPATPAGGNPIRLSGVVLSEQTATSERATVNRWLPTQRVSGRELGAISPLRQWSVCRGIYSAKRQGQAPTCTSEALRSDLNKNPGVGRGNQESSFNRTPELRWASARFGSYPSLAAGVLLFEIWLMTTLA